MVDNSYEELDEAKGRLKNALTRLENIVDQRILEASGKDNSELIANLTDKNTHLREENTSIQSKIGQEADKNSKLLNEKTQIRDRVDSLISGLEQILEEKDIARS